MWIGSPKKPVKKAEWRQQVEAGLNEFASRMIKILIILAIICLFVRHHLSVGPH